MPNVIAEEAIDTGKAKQWKAKIIKLSEIDSNGQMEVVYSILVDGKLAYDNLTTMGTPEDCKDNIVRMGSDLKTKTAQIEIDKILSEGMEIEI